MTPSEHDQFSRWFTAKDLAALEDVRHYVALHTLENISDVQESEQLKAAKATVQYYLDDPQAAEVFESYR